MKLTLTVEEADVLHRTSDVDRFDESRPSGDRSENRRCMSRMIRAAVALPATHFWTAMRALVSNRSRPRGSAPFFRATPFDCVSRPAIG
jgi:hypothetical protein